MAYKIILCLFIVFISCSPDSQFDSLQENLAVQSTCSQALIEVGGPFVGIEMHKSSPLLNRISFFYPVANSIDMSTDYWKRDQSRILCFDLKIDNHARELIGIKPYEFSLTPYRVFFTKNLHISLELDHWNSLRDKWIFLGIMVKPRLVY